MSLKDGISGRRIANKIKQALKGKESGESGTLGKGPPNRHGMPKLPPGQHSVTKWPVLDLGRQPTVAPEDWTLEVGGAIATRAIMADLRAGADMPNIGGPAPFTHKDRSKFLEALHLACERLKRAG